MPISAEKDHMGCGISGMLAPENRDRERRAGTCNWKYSFVQLWSSAELRILYKFLIPENHLRHSADPCNNNHSPVKLWVHHIIFNKIYCGKFLNMCQHAQQVSTHLSPCKTELVALQETPFLSEGHQPLQKFLCHDPMWSHACSQHF